MTAFFADVPAEAPLRGTIRPSADDDSLLSEEDDSSYSADYVLTEISDSYEYVTSSRGVSDCEEPKSHSDDELEARVSDAEEGSMKARTPDGIGEDEPEYARDEKEREFWSDDYIARVAGGVDAGDAAGDDGEDAVSLRSEEDLESDAEDEIFGTPSAATSDDMGPPAARTSDMEKWDSIYDCMGEAISRINGPHP